MYIGARLMGPPSALISTADVDPSFDPHADLSVIGDDPEVLGKYRGGYFQVDHAVLHMGIMELRRTNRPSPPFSRYKPTERMIAGYEGFNPELAIPLVGEPDDNGEIWLGDGSDGELSSHALYALEAGDTEETPIRLFRLGGSIERGKGVMPLGTASVKVGDVVFEGLGSRDELTTLARRIQFLQVLAVAQVSVEKRLERNATLSVS